MVVGHDVAHDRMALPVAQPGRGKVHRVVEAVRPLGPQRLQGAQLMVAVYTEPADPESGRNVPAIPAAAAAAVAALRA